MKIEQIMSRGILTVTPETTMTEAKSIMEKRGFRHLGVSDGKAIVGILSDRDIQRSMTVLNAGDKSAQVLISDKKLVGDYMSSPVKRMNADDSVNHAVREMLEMKVSCFIIHDQSGADVGILTTDDFLILLKDLLDSKVSLGEKLKNMFGVHS